MKRTCLCLLLLVCLVCTGCGASEEYARTAAIRRIGSSTNLDLSTAELIYFKDTHGGFHGDGVLALCMQLPGEHTGTLPSRYWQELPMTENMRLLLLGGQRDGVFYSYSYLEDHGFPAPASGCWVFCDKQLGSDSDRYTDAHVFDEDRYSQNWWCAWIDADTNRLYYIELDT